MDPETAALFPATIGDPTPPTPETVVLTPEQQQLAELRAELERERAAGAEREQRYLQSMDAMMTRAAAPPAHATAPVVPTFDLSDLPDAIQSPTEFKTKLVEKVNGFVTGAVQSSQQDLMAQMTRASALDGLWNKFNVTQPELAKRPALAQGAAAVTFNEMRARGIDPVAVAAQNPDSLIASIVTRMQAELGTPAGAVTTPGASGARAASVAGGSAGAGPTTVVTPKPPSFVDQHKAAQRALGLI